MANRTGARLGVLLVITALLVAGAGAAGAQGKAAPDFTLKDILEGKEYSLSQFKGKVVLINFFTFFCGPCRDEMPDLEKINQELKGKGYETIGIGLSSDPTQLRFLIKQLGVTYPVLLGDDKVAKAYGGVEVVPTTIIVDKQGNVAHKVLGTRKKEEFLKLIQPLL
ncbi:MAG: TlpA family protein disulfide reductase [Syntrophobacterales bacterium]|nr:TlpA family protein disulfide reductase [Syntrophobacterales bacterium]